MSPDCTLAVVVDGSGVKSVRISIQNRLSAVKTCRSSIPISIIVSARAVNARSVGRLMENSSGLILAVASPGKSRELVEESAAVGEEVGGRKGVGEHTSRARSVDIGAVSASDAAGSRAAIASYGTEASGDSAADVGGSALEELLELRGRAGRGSGSSVRCEAAAVANSGADGSTTSTSAVALNNSTFAELGDCGLNGGDLLGIDVDGDGLSRVSEHVSGENSGALFGVEEATGGGDVVGNALGEIIELCKLNFDLDGLTGLDGLEDFFREVGICHALEQTSERCLRGRRRDGQFVGGRIVEEGFLVEQLEVGLRGVGQRHLDLAVLSVR
jgi:hypothetical protein